MFYTNVQTLMPFRLKWLKQNPVASAEGNRLYTKTKIFYTLQVFYNMSVNIYIYIYNNGEKVCLYNVFYLYNFINKYLIRPIWYFNKKYLKKMILKKIS